MHDADVASPPRTHRGDPRRSRSGMWIVVLFTLPVLYVLSLGPVAWIESRFGPFSDGVRTVVIVFYYPLSLLFKYEVPGVEPALDWYVGLFLP